MQPSGQQARDNGPALPERAPSAGGRHFDACASYRNSPYLALKVPQKSLW